MFGVGFWVRDAQGGRRRFWVLGFGSGEWNARVLGAGSGVAEVGRDLNFEEGEGREALDSLALSIAQKTVKGEGGGAVLSRGGHSSGGFKPRAQGATGRSGCEREALSPRRATGLVVTAAEGVSTKDGRACEGL